MRKGKKLNKRKVHIIRKILSWYSRESRESLAVYHEGIIVYIQNRHIFGNRYKQISFRHTRKTYFVHTFAHIIDTIYTR